MLGKANTAPFRPSSKRASIRRLLAAKWAEAVMLTAEGGSRLYSLDLRCSDQGPRPCQSSRATTIRESGSAPFSARDLRPSNLPGLCSACGGRRASTAGAASPAGIRELLTGPQASAAMARPITPTATAKPRGGSSTSSPPCPAAEASPFPRLILPIPSPATPLFSRSVLNPAAARSPE